ncbi:MAG: hypothetical protein L6R36_007631 [Xanthoria steineri]|nr:MAG: hypothetical protein L6R36_007631 [Xanthoria steineri]
MEETRKRKSDGTSGQGANARRTKKPWQMPGNKFASGPSIHPGDAGIWATCDMHREGQCTAELKDLFNDYASLIYGNTAASSAAVLDDAQLGSDDIEAAINQEMQSLQNFKQEALFVPVKIDRNALVLFFKTREPVEPVSFVHRVCSDAMNKVTSQTTRHVKRLTPMTQMGKATGKSLEEVAKAVLAPVFHQDGVSAQKYAIRTTIRNNDTMKRDEVIKRVADLVGEPHTVDLKNYDRLILVDVYRMILGMSVVGGDYEKLKRFNMAEIYEPSSTADASKTP